MLIFYTTVSVQADVTSLRYIAWVTGIIKNILTFARSLLQLVGFIIISRLSLLKERELRPTPSLDFGINNVLGDKGVLISLVMGHHRPPVLTILLTPLLWLLSDTIDTGEDMLSLV